MSLIDKLEDLVVKVDTEYQQKMEAVIREIVPGMPEGNVRHAAECMCTDRMGSMMDIDIYILKEEDRPYECHYLKDLLEDRVARIAKMHEDESYTYNMDDNYWCATCGSHSHKRIPRQGIVGIMIQLIGLKRMGRMLEYKNKQLYNKEE